MTERDAEEAPEHRFGDAVVVIDHRTSHRPHKSTDFSYRVKRLGLVRVYRVEVFDDAIATFDDRRLAEYLLRHARHKSLLFAYRDGSA